MSGTAKLTADKVREIRWRSAAGESQRALGRRFGVHYTTVGRVLAGRLWAHVKPDATDGVLGFCMSADLPDYYLIATRAA